MEYNSVIKNTALKYNTAININTAIKNNALVIHEYVNMCVAAGERRPSQKVRLCDSSVMAF